MSFATRVSQVRHRMIPAACLALALALTPSDVTAQAADKTLPLSARTKGAATAPVTVYEMADFQCSFCGKFFRETWPTIEKEFITTGKVKWIFINYPLTQIHANAAAAAEFATCAGTQGKFWPAHDMLYGNQDSWEKLKDPVPFFHSKIKSLGLNADGMTTCLQSGVGRAMVRDDAAGAEKSGASSTPTFYIEGGLMAGAQPIEIFRPILDSIWKSKTKAKDRG